MRRFLQLTSWRVRRNQRDVQRRVFHVEPWRSASTPGRVRRADVVSLSRESPEHANGSVELKRSDARHDRRWLAAGLVLSLHGNLPVRYGRRRDRLNGDLISTGLPTSATKTGGNREGRRLVKRGGPAPGQRFLQDRHRFSVHGLRLTDLRGKSGGVASASRRRSVCAGRAWRGPYEFHTGGIWACLPCDRCFRPTQGRRPSQSLLRVCAEPVSARCNSRMRSEAGEQRPSGGSQSVRRTAMDARAQCKEVARNGSCAAR